MRRTRLAASVAVLALLLGSCSCLPADDDAGGGSPADESSTTATAEGAFSSVEYADSGRALAGPEAEAALEEVDEDALIAISSAQVFCASWPVEDLPESFDTQVTVDVPTLVDGGTLDPITPFADSEAQAEAMPDARFVAVPNAGHGAASFDDCTRSAPDAFWRDPTTDAPACVAEITATPFVVGG